MTLMTGCAMNVLMSAKCVRRGSAGSGPASRGWANRSWRPRRSELREAQAQRSPSVPPALEGFLAEELASSGSWRSPGL